MAIVKVLQERVVAHKRRIPGELVEVDENTARRMADEDPEAFVWVDRPVAQFVDVAPIAPVGENVAQTPVRKPARVRGKMGTVDVVGTEVRDGDESTG
jgi:hypothetical protein